MVKAGAVAAIALVGSAPFLTSAGLDWLHGSDIERVLSGDNVTQVANDIAQREFSFHVNLSVVAASSSPTLQGQLGDTLEPSQGGAFERVTLRVQNDGRLDVAVHTFHFAAKDDAGETLPAVLGSTDQFDVNQLRQGQNATGTVAFDLPRAARLASVTWQGELANATADLRP
jgi:hypothetical protein